MQTSVDGNSPTKSQEYYLHYLENFKANDLGDHFYVEAIIFALQRDDKYILNLCAKSLEHRELNTGFATEVKVNVFDLTIMANKLDLIEDKEYFNKYREYFFRNLLQKVYFFDANCLLNALTITNSSIFNTLITLENDVPTTLAEVLLKRNYTQFDPFTKKHAFELLFVGTNGTVEVTPLVKQFVKQSIGFDLPDNTNVITKENTSHAYSIWLGQNAFLDLIKVDNEYRTRLRFVCKSLARNRIEIAKLTTSERPPKQFLLAIKQRTLTLEASSAHSAPMAMPAGHIDSRPLSSMSAPHDRAILSSTTPVTAKMYPPPTLLHSTLMPAVVTQENVSSEDPYAALDLMTEPMWTSTSTMPAPAQPNSATYDMARFSSITPQYTQSPWEIASPGQSANARQTTRSCYAGRIYHS